MEKLVIDLDWSNLVVEKYSETEFTVYLQDKENNCVLQDIAAIRQALNDEKPVNGMVECLVWADENDENYTNQFIIKQYTEAG